VIRRALLIAIAMLALVPTGGFAAIAQPRGDSLAMDWSRVPEYRMVPGDELVLDFGPSADEARLGAPLRQRIRPDGRISVFPVGDVVAAGRTVRELETELVGMLSGELKRPRVSIQVSEVAGNQVHVLGRVTNPGSYKAEPFTTVTQAIARAGGFADDAARNSVIVFHRDGARTVRVARMRVGDALKRGRLEADLPLGRFDIVYVPRSGIGNLNQFSRQFFLENSYALTFAFQGWELFHLDRVFIPVQAVR
jgi:polysaccharide export outer membrane protein